MLADKKKAQKGLWRIPESTLLTVTLLGGSLGSLIGMKAFRHKTRKAKFAIGLPVILLLQLLLAGYIAVNYANILVENMR